jgi:hypothetical protein
VDEDEASVDEISIRNHRVEWIPDPIAAVPMLIDSIDNVKNIKQQQMPGTNVPGGRRAPQDENERSDARPSIGLFDRESRYL